MNTLQLVIGDKNFSPSSLRAWLLLRQNAIDFEEIAVELYKADTPEKLGIYSPSLKVPVLLHDGIRVWDSLAICEYISETFLQSLGWPMNVRKRAAARSVCAELHSGFSQFNRDWPMNCQASMKLKPSEAVEQDIARLDAIMYCCRRKYGDGGDYLFGNFTIADCLFAPYAIALLAYGAELSWKSQLYVHTLLENPHVQCWMEEAREEVQEFTWDKAG